MNIYDIFNTKAFDIIGAAAIIGLVLGLILYFAGMLSVLKRIFYDILWNHPQGKFDYNNFSRLLVLFFTLFIITITHIEIQFNPFRVVPEKPATELIWALLLYTLGESAFKMWFNKKPTEPDNKIEIKSETAIVEAQALKPKPKVKPAPGTELDGVVIPGVS